ncbi:Proton-dependent oligopeptide transporter family [Corchorus olitorius]|uniref:Proton-dependent oligopeptide transporter family n=1 Tax=Corchorus olitorius TaxID=93759 RepID=A0A1R3KI60_9ROSI|nr:Proton-dependent oligopeptide transporter family [Corchorus olitorius]
MEKKESFGGVENGADHLDEQSKKLKKGKKGGIKTMPFILGNEMCEKLAMVGFTKNMVNYLMEQFHMPLTQAANTVTNFSGTSSLTPLLGAFLADSYAGKFWTISAGTFIYLLGMILLTLTAALPSLRPPACELESPDCVSANGGQIAILYVSLMLAALGSGGIRPCVAAFGAEQFVEEDPRKPKKTWVFFNWYYFAMGSAILLAATVLVYIQDNVGWSLGLGIPTIAMAVSLILFVIGFPLYRYMDPSGSPYTRVFQVLVATFRKRNLPSPDPKCLYVNKELDATISTDGMLEHSNQFKFLDKAAIVTESDNVIASTKPNLWRLNTVHRVEELKCIVRLLPIWAAGILFATSAAQQSTFSLQQANTMDKHLTKSFQVPAASVSVFIMISMLCTIIIYDRVLVPVARKFTGLDRGINVLHRMAIGFFFSIAATLVAGLLEVKRKNAAISHGLADSPTATIPISVFWLVPQHVLHGIAEVFMMIGHLEFFYDQAPESMRSTATALFWLAISAGEYTSTLLVTLVHKYTNWLPDKNLNRGKLEYFYWLLTFLQVLNTLYYLICAKLYTFKSLQSKKKEGEEGVELASTEV